MAHNAPSLDFRLDRDSDLPLGAQLGWRLRTLIAEGRLAEGGRLPGVRDMAQLAGVNVNTVRSVYARLGDEGAIVSEHGRGTFVANAAVAREGLARARAALGTGRTPGAEAAPASGVHAPAASARTATAAARRRASLRAEIALLERELAALEPPNGGPGEGAEDLQRARPAAPQLLAAEELERIRDGLVARLRPLRAERDAARGDRERRRAEDVEREIERHKAAPVRRQRAIASSTPRFETGPAGGWSLRWRS